MSVPNPATVDWVPLTGRVDLRYLGAYVPAQAYTDGDIVAASDGINYLCVRPTSVAPTAWPGQGGAVANLAGTYASIPAANTVPASTLYYATDTLGGWRSDGTSWTLVQQGSPVITPAQLSSAPWSTPYDRMRMRLLVDDTNGIEWHFAYRAASASTYKWEFVGGPPAYVALAGISTTSGSWVADANGFTIPRAGYHMVSLTGRMSTVQASTLAQPAVRTRAGNEVIVGEQRATGSATTDFRAGCAGVVRHDCLVGDVATACIRNGSADGTSVALGFAFLTVTPVRIS